MRRFDFGDLATLRHTVVNEDGEPTDTTVTFVATPRGGDPIEVTPTHVSTGVYDVVVPTDQYALYDFAWTMSGTIIDVSRGRFYVADDDTTELPPLASLDRFGKKLGYDPTGPEADRAADALDAASSEIRGVAGITWADEDTGALLPIPRQIVRICVEVAYRAFANPEALTQRSIGDSNKIFHRATREGGEAVYLTDAEQQQVMAAAGLSSPTVITLVSPYSADSVDDPFAVIA